MPVFRYRLQPLLEQKIQLKDEAAQILFTKKQRLRTATEKLIELDRQQQVLAERKDASRRGLLAAGGPSGVSGLEIRRRSEYLTALGLDLEAAKDAVFAQKIFIDECNREVADAQDHLAKCSRDVEVLETPRQVAAAFFEGNGKERST